MSLTAAPKRPSHHKKISGKHHRHTKHYLKAYHPYLPLLGLVLVGLAINIFWAHRSAVLGASTNMTATQLLADTNQTREANNQDDLALNNKLSAAAQSKANDMAARGYWSHMTPDGKTPWTFITGSGYDYYAAGENLAYGFPNAESAIEGWMNSREHRANLLNPDFKDVGFGIATAKDFQNHGPTTIIVAMYAEPSLGLEAYGMSSDNTRVASNIPLHNVSRIELLTKGQAAWSYMLVSLVMLLAIFWFLVRHFKVWKRVLVESEEFVVHHRFLDILIVATAVTAFILTRTAGFIH